MNYICLVYQDEKKLESTPEADFDAIVGECGEWVGELEKGGNHVYSTGLQSVRTAATLRLRDGKVSVTDGPFAETKEVLAGFTILQARDLNEAIQLASKLPAVQLGSVEVRPVLDAGTDVTDPLDQKIVASVRRAGHPQLA